VAARGSLRSLFSSRGGRYALLAIAILTLIACFVYLGPTGPYLAIPDLLLFGLVLPIYSGWKRPRHLALYGLAAMLISVPFSSVLALNYVYQPSLPQDSPVLAGTQGPILQGAIASPYTGPAGSSFWFNVTVNPTNVPANASPPLWVALWVSTCPGATGPSDPYCAAGYPLLEANRSFPGGLNQTATVSFSLPINDSNIWSWQMGAAYDANWNATNASQDGNLTWVFLSVYAVQGPIVGPYSSILGLALEAFLVSVFIPAGLVFYVGLLGYMWLKAREARRKAMEGRSGPVSAGPTVPGAPPPSGAPPAPATPELSCPNCHAVVYPNESTCWKCGASLRAGAAAAAPLPSQK